MAVPGEAPSPDPRVFRQTERQRRRSRRAARFRPDQQFCPQFGAFVGRVRDPDAVSPERTRFGKQNQRA
jgi:hypothetical protein